LGGEKRIICSHVTREKPLSPASSKTQKIHFENSRRANLTRMPEGVLYVSLGLPVCGLP